MGAVHIGRGCGPLGGGGTPKNCKAPSRRLQRPLIQGPPLSSANVPRAHLKVPILKTRCRFSSPRGPACRPFDASLLRVK